MSECTHDCASCKEKCASPEIQVEKPNRLSSVKKVIGVVSGKGGVGKSLVSALLASGLTKKGYRTPGRDADLTGPSIPKVFGLQEKAEGCEDGILPALTRDGVQVMSINLLLEDPGDPVVWRGPVIAGTVKQFWTDVIWSDVDFMFVDMPPGTGDVPLTVFPHCGETFSVFGASKVAQTAADHGLPVLLSLPIDPKIAALCDEGRIEDYESDAVAAACERLVAALPGQ